MTRRQFLRNAAVTAAVAPHVPTAIARVTTPGAQQVIFVDWTDIAWPKAANYQTYDFIGGPAQVAAFKRMWEEGMKHYEKNHVQPAT